MQQNSGPPPRVASNGRNATPWRPLCAGRARAAALLGVLIAGIGVAAPGGAPAARASAAAPASAAAAGRVLPTDVPARGLVYRGLTVATAGTPCDRPGTYRIAGTTLCTHGPDAAPAGLDVRRPAREPAGSPAAGEPIPCEGDGVSGHRTEVMYVRPAPGPDGYADAVATITASVAGVDAIYDQSAAETNGTRHVRLVHTADCRLVVRNVVVPAGATDSFDATIAAVQALGYSRTDRKYLMFVDDDVYCGIATVVPDDQPGTDNLNDAGPSYARADRNCWDATVAAHEHNHTLGSVQLSAPHSSGGFHCVDEHDIMCYSDAPNYPAMQYLCSDQGQQERFDCNHDDYFHTDPPPGSYLATHWNTADSRYLMSGPCAPGNDPFAGAVALDGVAQTLGTMTCATAESGEPVLSAPLTSVWYRWTAPRNGTATVSTCNAGTDFDTVLGVYTGTSLSGLTLRTTADDDATCSWGTTRSTLRLAVTGGTTYLIQVDGYLSQSGDVGLTVGLGAPGQPAIGPAFAGDGWAVVGWEAPASTGASPINGYMVTPRVTPAGPVGATARRAVIEGLAKGSAVQLRVVARNRSGPGPASRPSVSVVPSGAPLPVTTRYSSADRARLLKSAAYLGLDPARLQRDAVAALAFIVALGPQESTPIVPPDQSGAASYTTTWIAADQPALVALMRHFAVTPPEAQALATAFVGYLLALDGH